MLFDMILISMAKPTQDKTPAATLNPSSTNLRNRVQRRIDSVRAKIQGNEHQQRRGNAKRQRHDRKMQNICPFKIACVQCLLDLRSSPAPRDGIAEISPHLQEDRKGQSQRDGRTSASTGIYRHGDAQRTRSVHLGGNGAANHDGAHKHCFKSRSDGYTRLDIAHNRTDQHTGE